MWKFVSRGIRETLERRANCRTNVYSQSQDGTVLQSEVNPTNTLDKHDLPNNRYFNMCRGIRLADPITEKSRGSKWNPKYSWTEAVEWSGLLAVGWVICQSLCLHRRFFGPDPEAPLRKRISQVHDVRISHLFSDLICIRPSHILPITNCVGTRNDNKESESGAEDLSWSSQKPYGPITIEEALKDAGDEFTKVHRIVMGEYEFQMGSKALEEKRYKEAVKHFSTGASLSSSASMFNLALCHELGLGTFVNLKEAAKRYQAAADSGHADAMYNLGVYHAQGKGGLKVNLQMARELFTEAARLGQPEARHALSLDKPSRQIVNERDAAMRCAPIDKSQNVNKSGSMFVRLVGL